MIFKTIFTSPEKLGYAHWMFFHVNDDTIFYFTDDPVEQYSWLEMKRDYYDTCTNI